SDVFRYQVRLDPGASRERAAAAQSVARSKAVAVRLHPAGGSPPDAPAHPGRRTSRDARGPAGCRRRGRARRQEGSREAGVTSLQRMKDENKTVKATHGGVT